MASNDMLHLGFLDAVRHSDVETIREKEATYQGSWKRAGGSSAWFMARRNMDRLITMMAPPKDEIQFSLLDLDDAIQSAAATHHGDCTLDYSVVQYLRDQFVSEDIFRKIEERPDGGDGTVLACVRDLRCYFTLIEAEMMAQGIVAAPNAPVEDKPVEVKTEVAAPVTPAAQAIYGRDGGRLFSRRLYAAHLPGGVLKIVRAETLYSNGMVEITDGTVCNEVAGTSLSELEIAQDDAVLGSFITTEVAAAPTTSEDGGYKENGVPGQWAPWAIDLAYVREHGLEGSSQLNTFYRQQTSHLWVLEPAVPCDGNLLPERLSSYYDNVVGEFWLLNIEKCPADARDWFPHLSKEQNRFEHDCLPAWQKVLYYWDDKNGKYTLINDAWARD